MFIASPTEIFFWCFPMILIDFRSLYLVTEQRIISATFPAPSSDGCNIDDCPAWRTKRFAMLGNIKWTTELEMLRYGPATLHGSYFGSDRVFLSIRSIDNKLPKTSEWNGRRRSPWHATIDVQYAVLSRNYGRLLPRVGWRWSASVLSKSSEYLLFPVSFHFTTPNIYMCRHFSNI